MNLTKIFSTAAVIISLTATTTFAATDFSTSKESLSSTTITESRQYADKDLKDLKEKHRKFREEFRKDPINALESRKSEIQSLLKEGKITKEEADKKIERLDSKIKEIQNFNRLTLPQKKDKLINDCKSSLEKRVKEGKIDRNKADQIIKDYTEKINKWDGNGYPQFHSKPPKCKCMPDNDR